MDNEQETLPGRLADILEDVLSWVYARDWTGLRFLALLVVVLLSAAIIFQYDVSRRDSTHRAQQLCLQNGYPKYQGYAPQEIYCIRRNAQGADEVVPARRFGWEP